MNLKIFHHHLNFTKTNGFMKSLKSPSGSHFSVTTGQRDSKIVIRPGKLARTGVREPVLSIPLHGEPYAISFADLDSATHPLLVLPDKPLKKQFPNAGIMAVIPGPRPPKTVIPGPKTTALVIGGPKPPSTVIPGPKPKSPPLKPGAGGDFITIQGPKPKPKPPGGSPADIAGEPLRIELDATKGNWHLEPADDALHISFDSLKIK